jgi:DNA-binding CsgD family transcriptional regulator
MPATKQNTRRLPDVIAREQRIIQWVSEGLSFDEIAIREGVTHSRVRQIYARGLKRFPAQHIETHRAAQRERIRIAISELFELARNPKASFTARALTYSAIKAWSDREARLLGLDMPARTEVSVLSENTVDDAIRSLAGDLALRAAQAGVPLELPPGVLR